MARPTRRYYETRQSSAFATGVTVRKLRLHEATSALAWLACCLVLSGCSATGKTPALSAFPDDWRAVQETETGRGPGLPAAVDRAQARAPVASPTQLSFGAAPKAQQLPEVSARQLAALSQRERETVLVTSTSGSVMKGTIVGVDLENEIVKLQRNDGLRLNLPAEHIRRIERVNRDSVRNGALIGAATGFGFAALMCANCNEGFYAIAAVSLLSVPIGALIGAGWDLAYSSRETIYRGPLPATPSRPTRRHEVSFRVVW